MPLMDVFFDSDVIIAGSVSSTGASSVLLQLCEYRLINGITCQQVYDECKRNIIKKIPEAIDVFEQIIHSSLSIMENAEISDCGKYSKMADEKDLIILISAIQMEVKYFVTFNVKHFYPHKSIPIKVVKPSELLHVIRDQLSEF